MLTLLYGEKFSMQFIIYCDNIFIYMWESNMYALINVDIF